MVKKQIQLPQELLKAMSARTVVIVVGGDLLEALKMVPPGQYASSFVKKLRDELNEGDELNDFFDIGFAFSDEKSLHYLNEEIGEYVKSLDSTADYILLKQLALTRPRMVISTWFDSVFFDQLKKEYPKIKPIITEDQFIYLDNKQELQFMYLLGAPDSPNSLITDSNKFSKRLDRSNLLAQKIIQHLVSKTFLFIGFRLSGWFNFENLYDKLRSITPGAHAPKNFFLTGENVSKFKINQFNKEKGLEIICPVNLPEYLGDLCNKVLEVQFQKGLEKQRRKPNKLPDKPYKYLDYYDKGDSDILYGRERDKDIITSLILGHNITLIYGASGVGKSSLLHAGIGPKFTDMGRAFLITRVIPNPAKALEIVIGSSVEKHSLGSWYDQAVLYLENKPINECIIVFDQFEEFFTDLSADIRMNFWNDVARCMDEENKIKLVFSLRQELLYQFKEAFPAIPKPHDNLYCVEKLNLNQQREVILDVAKLYDKPWSPELINQLEEDLASQQIESAHLSIILTVLWEKRNSKEKDLDTYKRLGQINGILGNYLWDRIHPQSDSAELEEILKAFVSPENRKTQVTVDDLYAELSYKKIEIDKSNILKICDRLIDYRLVRKVIIDLLDYLELSHDMVAIEIGKKISGEEMESKLAKRDIKMLMQDWQSTSRLPGRSKFDEVRKAFEIAALNSQEVKFVALVYANSEQPVDDLLTKLTGQNAGLLEIYQLFSECDSIFVQHELLRRITQEYQDDFNQFFTRLAGSQFPSIRLHLSDSITFLKNKGVLFPHVFDPLPPDRFVMIAEGSHRLGFHTDSNDPTAIPEQEVYLSEFSISKYLTTNLDYLQFVKATGYKIPESWEQGRIPFGKEYHPVVKVSWHDAMAYCQWLSDETGDYYRLPTEAEWDKAAAWDENQKNKKLYPWGNQFISENSNYYGSGYGSTTPVGMFSPRGDSSYQISDLAGNVFEWLLDDAFTVFENYDTGQNPVHLAGRHTKMTKGGSYGGPPEQLASSYRSYERNQIISDNYVGFRWVKGIKFDTNNL